EAKRIWARLGLAPVVARHRGNKNRQPVAAGWPHGVRPEGYYGDDVTRTALELACGSNHGAPTASASPSQELLELLPYRSNAGPVEDVKTLVAGPLQWLRQPCPPRRRGHKQVEAGCEDLDGSPLGEDAFRQQGLRWNGGTIPRIAQGIRRFGRFT